MRFVPVPLRQNVVERRLRLADKTRKHFQELIENGPEETVGRAVIDLHELRGGRTINGGVRRNAARISIPLSAPAPVSRQSLIEDSSQRDDRTTQYLHRGRRRNRVDQI